jgi:hypothetical protein
MSIRHGYFVISPANSRVVGHSEGNQIRRSGRSRYSNLPQNTHLRMFIQARNG